MQSNLTVYFACTSTNCKNWSFYPWKRPKKICYVKWTFGDFWYVILWHLNYRWAKIQLDNFLFHVKVFFWLFLPVYIDKMQHLVGANKTRTNRAWDKHSFPVGSRGQAGSVCVTLLMPLSSSDIAHAWCNLKVASCIWALSLRSL